MSDPTSSSSAPSENNQDSFGSVSWVSDQLRTSPLPVDMAFNEEAWYTAETQRISDVITKLENGLVSQKDKEIDQLKRQIERKNAFILHLATKIATLKSFLSWENEELGKFLGALVEMGSKDFSASGPVLKLGPFKDANEVDECQRILGELSIKMKNGVAKRNHDKLAKVTHALLKSKELSTPASAQPTSTTTGFTIGNDMDTTIPDPGFGASLPTATAISGFILTPGMPNRAIPAYRQVDYNSFKVAIQLDGNQLGLINSSVLIAKHGVDLTKLGIGHFCLCGMKLSSAESLGQHVMVSGAQ